MSSLALDSLWTDVGFRPNASQEAATWHTAGPLYLPAGPNLGKTHVRLWRAVNSVVFHGVVPERVLLWPLTGKAAFQLREGPRALLDIATACTGRPHDVAGVYVGMTRSLRQQLLTDQLERRLAGALCVL